MSDPIKFNADWLKARMEELGLGDTEVTRRMEAYGFNLTRTAVTNWRAGRAPISPEYFPILCLALDYPLGTMAEMTVSFTADALPYLAPFLMIPVLGELEKLEASLKKSGLAARKARLMAELQELEVLESA
jgi:hypothetical protein